MNHSQENSEFILLNITPLHHQKYKNSHVKIITYMNNDNGFDLIISLVFAINPQLGGLEVKS